MRGIFSPSYLEHFAETANSEPDGESLVFDGLDGLVLVWCVQLDVADGHDVVAGEQHPRLASRALRDHVLDEDAGSGAVDFVVDLNLLPF